MTGCCERTNSRGKKATVRSAWGIFVILAMIADYAAAHDPGLSFAELSIDGTEVVLQASFAVRDFAGSGPADSGNTENPSAIGAYESEKRIYDEVLQQTLMFADGYLIEPESSSFARVDADGLRVIARYRVDAGARLVMDVPLLRRLPSGHRQFVQVSGDQDNELSFLLSSTDSRVVLDNHKADWQRSFDFFCQGVWHIWIGLDHLLFLFALLLPAGMRRKGRNWVPCRSPGEPAFRILKVVSAFTVAHSITLGLAVYDLVSLPGALVESVIAVSVIVAAGNNIWPTLHERLWPMAFIFGLIHGFGFATVLGALEISSAHKSLALLMFNAGVEAGQLVVVAAVLPVILLLRSQTFYRHLILQAGSVAILCISVLWLLDRSGIKGPVDLIAS